ncbi:MAG: 4-(cytidine 5'-diphospho)-2-C-methyl-D-erythritol kinase [Chloroflexi bacterium]|nr:4-(cytidine 5'-diphospho)-2-C-methyl-D-erythritol kinase [Chloroflexota bacterium]
MNDAAREGILTCRAHAKVNLTLEILGKRPDGYHEIVSVMQTLALCDSLTFRPASGLSLSSNRPELEGTDNLVLRAAHELWREARAGDMLGASIDLLKRIPVAGGLGGGSSDAACALRKLDELWELDLPKARLLELAAHLGSDVPYFFYGGTALAEGRGELVSPLPQLPRRWVVLVCPRVEIPEKTRRLYGRIKASHCASGEATRRLVEDLQKGRGIDPRGFANTFLPVLLEENAVVRSCYERMAEAGIQPILLSGAGPTLYTLLESEEEARQKSQRLQFLETENIASVLLTQTISSEEVFADDAEGS